MAANNFATLVHNNTNNITLILVYAFLEWVLIFLLLLNSIFSYLIVEFANYFGLKPPCPWCSRIDHFLNPKKGKDFQKDLLCENHAAEIYHHLGCFKNGSSLSGEEECLKGDDGSNGNVLPQQHLEFFLGHDGFRLIPIELIDSRSDEHKVKCENREKDLDFELNETMEMEENQNSIIEQKNPKAYSEVEYEDEDEGDEFLQLPLNETEADVSIGTEIPDLDLTDEISVTVLNEEQFESETIELKPISIELTEHHLLSIDEENNNLVEEEKVPETPTSLDSFHQLHKKTDESLDGSVVSEPEGIDGISSVEKLQAALRAERKTLHALYMELEEERSASAVAANETMAMINRLQEEKAAMQMESLQYQRMMDEQSEYDQEALQLLNDLMTKREREKLELERALEIYRKRVIEYESKEKTKRGNRSMRSESSCGSSIHAGESDGLSIDLDRETENHNTPVDEVLKLEETLGNYEDERVQILQRLQVLQQKLLIIEDNEHGYRFNREGDLEVQKMDGTNGKLMGAEGKRLLPLFDALHDVNGSDDELGPHGCSFNGEYGYFEGCSFDPIELEERKVAVEEEADHLFERLQAVEADREFIKHCIRSLKKGDKGMDLLQGILQHLQNLREVEFQAKNIDINYDDDPLL
ncbi:myosin-binding protein 3-like [Impatiens glandulifera]|uniref:myosin-binding protein 3-like n=1 Tax=Impatiens glandulifera TaxID=253017 RepID=UPI001FB13FE7|nr:myosin-binding protein 3-like [Impatiens glandulifera]XP_047333142.1 myosin-binding protein 3-like [Impatiens glandulifera]